MPNTSRRGAIGSVLAVDANVLISVLRRGSAMRVLTCPRLAFFTSVHTTWEVSRYLPKLAAFLRGRGLQISESALERMFRQLPIVALPDTFYRGCMPRARELIAVRDPEDVDILALALRLQVPLWTDDKDFDSVPDIPILSTQQVLSLLSS